MDTQASRQVGVSRDTICLRYEAAQYDRDMSRYLDSLDPRFAQRMTQRVCGTARQAVEARGGADIAIPAVGSGRIFDEFAAAGVQGIDALGFDFNPKMLVGAQLRAADFSGGRVELRHLDIMEALQAIGRSAFDLVVWEYSGCLMVDPISAWKELVELLRSGGFLVYNDYVGAFDRSIAHEQARIREAARSVGMNWFRPGEVPPELLASQAEIFVTNDVVSTFNDGLVGQEKAIVWDPSYDFQRIVASSWFAQAMDVIELEIDTRNVMESNVSAVFRRK